MVFDESGLTCLSLGVVSRTFQGVSAEIDSDEEDLEKMDMGRQGGKYVHINIVCYVTC